MRPPDAIAMINMPSASGLLPGGKRSSNSLMGHYAL
jgi:hypothetical protein